MSIHVCKCIHNGTEEFHLRMPGVPESRAEAIASLINSGKLDQADYQAATSRQEAKIKALVEALEGVAAMARCGQLDEFIGEPWLNSVHQALAVGDWPDDSREAYLELKQAIAQEQEIARRCYTCKSFAIRNVDKCRSCNKDYSNWEPKP